MSFRRWASAPKKALLYHHYNYCLCYRHINYSVQCKHCNCWRSMHKTQIPGSILVWWGPQAFCYFLIFFSCILSENNTSNVLVALGNQASLLVPVTKTKILVINKKTCTLSSTTAWKKTTLLQSIKNYTHANAVSPLSINTTAVRQ